MKRKDKEEKRIVSKIELRRCFESRRGKK